MANIDYSFENSIPIGPLKIAALDSCKDFAKKVDDYIVSFRQHDAEALAQRQSMLDFRGYDSKSYLLDFSCPRFGSGEAKCVLKESVRGSDIFAMVDVTNYSLTYQLCGEVNHMSPDNHYQDLKRLIGSCRGARRVNVVMPFLYEGRQHKRTRRESLDCALALEELIDMGVQMVTSLISGIVSNAPTIASAAVQIVETLVEGIAELLPLLIEGAAQLIAGLATGLAKSLPKLVPTIVDVVLKIVQTLIDNIPLLIDAALQLITGLAQGIINAIPVIVAALPQVITSLIDGLLSAIPQIIQAGIDLLTALVAALPEIIAAIVEAIPQIIDGIITALTENIPLIIQAGIDLLVALIQALPEIIVTIVQAIPQIISSIVNALIGNIDQIIMAGVQLFVALIQNLPTIIVEIVKAVPQIVSGIVQAFASLGGELVNAGANLLHGLWEGISGAASWLWEKVSGWASSLVSGIKDFFGIHSPSTVFAEIGGNMADGVGVGFTDNMGGVEGDMTAAMGGAGALTAAEAVNAVNNGIIANIEGLSGAVNAIVERVITGLTAQAQRFNQAGQDFDKNIASGMVTAIVQITQKIPQIVQSIITAFTAQHQKFVSEGTNIDKSIAQGMIVGIPQITGKVAQIVQPIITALRSYVSEFTAAGEEMVRGIWQGFQNMSGWLESKVRSMMREIVAAVEAEMQINSPSKVFARIGSYMAQGLGEGFAREMRDVESTIRRETSNAVPEFRSGEGRDTRGGGTPSVEVVQNIYANETSYAEQQRQAARQFRQIAREVMA